MMGYSKELLSGGKWRYQRIRSWKQAGYRVEIV